MLVSIFHWLRGSSDEPELNPQLKKRLDELEERNRRTEKQLNALELDWSEWFNKFRLLYARLTKRINDEQKKDVEDAPGSTIEEQPDRYNPPIRSINRQRKNY